MWLPLDPLVGVYFQHIFHRCLRHLLNNCGLGGLDNMQIQIQNPRAACVGSPHSSACNLPSDSPSLKDTEDGVKEVSRV